MRHVRTPVTHIRLIMDHHFHLDYSPRSMRVKCGGLLFDTSRYRRVHSPQLDQKSASLGSDLSVTSAAAMLGSAGEVNVNRPPSHSVSVCLPASFAIQISAATLSECVPVVLLLPLYRPAYRVSFPFFSCLLKHPGRYKRRD